MFKDALRALVDGTEGGVGCVIMDATGIALESYAKDGGGFDVNNVGVEYSVVLTAVKRAAEMLEAGATREIVINTEKLVTIIRWLNDAYFLALTLKPEGNIGKGRFLMRTQQHKIVAEL